MRKSGRGRKDKVEVAENVRRKRDTVFTNPDKKHIEEKKDQVPYIAFLCI
jgi:hypothetical protein